MREGEGERERERTRERGKERDVDISFVFGAARTQERLRLLVDGAWLVLTRRIHGCTAEIFSDLSKRDAPSGRRSCRVGRVKVNSHVASRARVLPAHTRGN